MHNFTQVLTDIVPKYPIEKICDRSSALFVNIETTGYSAQSSNLYLIGCVYYENDNWNLVQFLADNYDEEEEILKAFLELCLKYSYLIHFNGNQFDIPYLQQKCTIYNIPFLFEVYNGLDLYKRIKPYKNFLKLEDCKQKTLESYLGLTRQSETKVSDLINIYHDYVCNQSEELRNDILLHNKESVVNLLYLMDILSVVDIFNNPLRVMKVQANYYNDYENKKRQELVLTLRFLTPLPSPISFSSLGCYFTGNDMTGLLKVPLYEEELKYFYSNYNDYYYLPEEDVAIHKSVASYVDKDHRKNATQATCYTRKQSLYLPEWEDIFTPFYKRKYKDKNLYFELTDEFKTSRESFNKYAEHVLSSMLLNES